MSKIHFKYMLTIILVLVFAHFSYAQIRAQKLISTDWLLKNLSKKNIRLIDVRSSIKQYWAGHIPGAVYLNIDTLRWPDKGVPAKLMPPEAFVKLLSEMGIEPNTMIVVYSEKNDYKPTYLIWALDYIGHKNAAILNGGFSKWKKEGRPITKDYPSITAKVYKIPSRFNEDVRANIQEVKEAVLKGNATLLDVRPLPLYKGIKGDWKRKGHIKGAKHWFWKNALKKNGLFKDAERLKNTFERLGITPDKDIIVSCGQGLMSAHTYFTLKYILGYNKVANYDGGFSEWSNFENLPVEKGLKLISVDPKKLLNERCNICHSLRRIYKKKAEKSVWKQTISRMLRKGAKLTKGEFKILIDYLSKANSLEKH